MDEIRFKEIKAIFKEVESHVRMFGWNTSNPYATAFKRLVDACPELISEVERLQPIEAQFELTMKCIEMAGLSKVVTPGLLDYLQQPTPTEDKD